MSDQTQTTGTQTESNTEGESQTTANAEQGKETKVEKLFTQAELDAKVESRLMQERKQASDREAKAKTDAAAKALEEQGEFKKLADERGKSLETLTAERDALVAERDAFQATAGKYEKSLRAMLDAQKAGIPEHVKPLLDKLPIDEQFDWIAANQGQIKVNGVPFTPKPDGTGLSAAQKEAVQKQTDRDYRRSF